MPLIRRHYLTNKMNVSFSSYHIGAVSMIFLVFVSTTSMVIMASTITCRCWLDSDPEKQAMLMVLTGSPYSSPRVSFVVCGVDFHQFTGESRVNSVKKETKLGMGIPRTPTAIKRHGGVNAENRRSSFSDGSRVSLQGLLVLLEASRFHIAEGRSLK